MKRIQIEKKTNRFSRDLFISNKMETKQNIDAENIFIVFVDVKICGTISILLHRARQRGKC